MAEEAYLLYVVYKNRYNASKSIVRRTILYKVQ